MSGGSGRSGTVEGQTAQLETGKKEAGAGDRETVLVAGSLGFCTAVVSNPNLGKPCGWFWRLLCISVKPEKTIFLFPGPPHVLQPRMIPLLTE